MKTNQHGIAHVYLIALLVVVLGGIGFTGYRVVNSHQPVATVTAAKTTTPKETTSLKIQSDPAGITMSGSPLCDSTKLNKTTPYTCTHPNNSSIDTVIAAPDQVTINGKVYNFVTWDGCSASNTNKAICKVHVDAGKSGILKASYAVVSTASHIPSASTTSKATSTPPTSSHTVASSQCANSLILDTATRGLPAYNYTCKITLKGQNLWLSLESVNGTFETEPPITVLCSQACGFVPANTSTVINSKFSLVNNYNQLGYIQTVPTTLTFTFPKTVSQSSKSNATFSFVQESNFSSNQIDATGGGGFGSYYIYWHYQINNTQ